MRIVILLAELVNSNYWRTFIGADAAGANLNQLSPLKRAGDADAPIMLLDTKANWTMVIVQSPQMERALRQAGKSVERTVIDGDDVRLRTAATRLDLLKATVPFVESPQPQLGPELTSHGGRTRCGSRITRKRTRFSESQVSC